MGQPVLSEFTGVGVHLLKKVRPLLALFGVHGAEYRLRHAQAETYPDYFDAPKPTRRACIRGQLIMKVQA